MQENESKLTAIILKVYLVGGSPAGGLTLTRCRTASRSPGGVLAPKERARERVPWSL